MHNMYAFGHKYMYIVPSSTSIAFSSLGQTSSFAEGLVCFWITVSMVTCSNPKCWGTKLCLALILQYLQLFESKMYKSIFISSETRTNKLLFNYMLTFAVLFAKGGLFIFLLNINLQIRTGQLQIHFDT